MNQGIHSSDLLTWHEPTVEPPAEADLLLEHVGGFRVYHHNSEEWVSWREITIRWAVLPPRML